MAAAASDDNPGPSSASTESGSGVVAAESGREVGFFGGAIVVEVPRDFFDVSAVRVVPDNQEVWASTESDESLIVEIVEPPEATDDLAVGRFFFEDILDQNDAHADGLFSLDSVERLSPALTPHLPSGAYAVGVVGTMKASKFREAARNTVRVLLAVLRLPRLETDILLTLNAPLELHPASSSVNALLHASDGPLAMRRFLAALQSFRVRDWSLFGPIDAYPAGDDGAASGGGDEEERDS